MLKTIVRIAFLILAGAVPALAGAQTLHAGPAYTSADGFSAPAFPHIDILVQPASKDGAPLAFQPSDIRLYSNGGEISRGIAVRTFGESGYGVQSILALDLSGSMTGAPLSAVRASMASFVNQARKQDQVEVLSFADDTRVEVPFGASKDSLATSLKQVKGRGNQTHLYDAMLDALAKLNASATSSNLRRQFTVVSDGHDEGSHHSVEEVIERALAEKVSIDSVGLTRSHPEYLAVLARIAQSTGGRYAQAKSPQELEGLIAKGIQAMRATPMVAFDAGKLDSDGKTHMLEVRWQPSGKTPQEFTATVELRVPEIVHPSPRRRWMIWASLVALCFIAGVILLLVARRRRRLENEAPPNRAPAQVWPSHSEVEPHGLRAPLATNKEYGDPPRPKPPAVAVEPTHADEVRLAERARTRIVARFDAGRVPVLEATAGPFAGRSFPLSEDFRIGAIPGNSLVLPDDPTLSGFHARLLLADSVLAIEDSQSTNGTFVNGVRLGRDRKLLKPGDEIAMGASIFQVRSG